MKLYKKSSLLLILSIAILSLAACGKSNKKNKEKPEENTPSEQVTTDDNANTTVEDNTTTIEKIDTPDTPIEPDIEEPTEPKPPKEIDDKPKADKPKVEQPKPKPKPKPTPTAGSWIKVDNTAGYDFNLSQPKARLTAEHDMIKLHFKGTFTANALPALGLYLFVYDDKEKSYTTNQYIVRKSIPIVWNSDGKSIDLSFNQKLKSGTYFYTFKDEGLGQVVHKGQIKVE